MKRVLRFLPALRLTALLRRPGGFTRRQAAARAHARLHKVRARCLVGLDDKIDALAAGWKPGADASRHLILAQAGEIFSIAATFGESDVAHAAGCLCDLLSLIDEAHFGEGDLINAQTASPLFISAIHVHVDALRRLRRPERGGDVDGRYEVVAGLQRVTRKLVNSERAAQEDMCDKRIEPPHEEFVWSAEKV